MQPGPVRLQDQISAEVRGADLGLVLDDVRRELLEMQRPASIGASEAVLPDDLSDMVARLRRDGARGHLEARDTATADFARRFDDFIIKVLDHTRGTR